jgi:hypothetical protein
MDAGSVGWAGIWVAHAVIFISRYFSRKFFLLRKGSSARETREKTRKFEEREMVSPFCLFSRCLACFAGLFH